MGALVQTHTVQIEAPDGPAALQLERRLVSVVPTAVSRQDHWLVEIPVVRDVDAVEDEVRDWLRCVGTESTTVRVDGSAHVVRSYPRARHRGSNQSFIG